MPLKALFLVLFQFGVGHCEFKVLANHYENLPMQYTEIFSTVKIKNFNRKF